MTQVAPFFSKMENYIQGIRNDIVAGKNVEMVALDENIGHLCDMVMKLSEEERMMYEERLHQLLESLNMLGRELKDHFGEGDSIAAHRNATVAYKTADSRDNFGKREEDE